MTINRDFFSSILIALYGNLFGNNEEAAFSNYRLWESMGFIVAFINGNLICIDEKLYLLLGILTLGMLCYFIIEILQRSKTRKSISIE